MQRQPKKPKPRQRSTTFDVGAGGTAQSPGGIAHETGELHRILVESVQDYAIFALDPHGFVLSWNAGAERFKGYKAHEIIGKHFSVFYPEAKIAEGFPEHELRMAMAHGRFEDEGWRVRKDGSRFWANVVITALWDDSDQHLGFAKVTRDLTARREAEQRAVEDARRMAAEEAARRAAEVRAQELLELAERLRRQAGELEAANRTKATFLASMSHELRTPLNAIGGYVDLLLAGVRGPLSEDQAQDLDRIRRSQQHLLGVINDILNFSRIEAGQLTYEISPVDMSEVVEAVAPMIEPQALSKGLSVSRDSCASSFMALGDRSKVEQILLNLLSNAVKFTDPGGTITLTCRREDDFVTLAVHDTGSGIPADQLDRIFEPFVQVGRSLTSAHEGTGLGLAISHDLARAMGGRITVESVLGEGSTFTLELPAADPHDRQASDLS